MSRSAVTMSDTPFRRTDVCSRFEQLPTSLMLGVTGLGLLLGGCAEPSVLTVPAREPRMTLADHERIPLPIVARPTGAATFDRASNESAREGLSLLPAGRPDAE